MGVGLFSLIWLISMGFKGFGRKFSFIRFSVKENL